MKLLWTQIWIAKGQKMSKHRDPASSVEGLELVGLDWCLIFVKVSEWVLSTVVVGIIVRIDGLGLEAGNGVKLLDSRCSQASECSEHSSLDLSHLGILDCVHKSVLCFGRMILQLLGGIFLTERGNLVEVHLKIMCHLLCEIILWRTTEVTSSGGHGQDEHCNGTEHCFKANSGFKPET